MTKKIIKNIVIAFCMLGILLIIIFISSPSLFLKQANSEFRNLKFDGKVVNKIIDKEKYEKTHTVILSDSTIYTISRTDLDNEISIGDSIYKSSGTYEIIIYKNCNLNDRIVYALPYTE